MPVEEKNSTPRGRRSLGQQRSFLDICRERAAPTPLGQQGVAGAATVDSDPSDPQRPQTPRGSYKPMDIGVSGLLPHDSPEDGEEKKSDSGLFGELDPDWAKAAQRVIADCPDLVVRGHLREFHASAVEVAYRISGMGRAAAEQDAFGHLIAEILNRAAGAYTQSPTAQVQPPTADTDGILERWGATQGVAS